jgi:hypothetical protein
MKIDVTVLKDPLMGWNLNFGITADVSEEIHDVTIRVNDYPEVRDSCVPPVNDWSRALSRKGNYPGENKLEVEVVGKSGQMYRKKHVWGE